MRERTLRRLLDHRQQRGCAPGMASAAVRPRIVAGTDLLVRQAAHAVFTVALANKTAACLGAVDRRRGLQAAVAAA